MAMGHERHSLQSIVETWQELFAAVVKLRSWVACGISCVMWFACFVPSFTLFFFEVKLPGFTTLYVKPTKPAPRIRDD